mmetsp:Transcript_28184/g.71532  ORF Transcript_28184/g.71532 Transcript_28184/m.71532 type:complete len:212 (-) Transcript_28184:233-868(-)
MTFARASASPPASPPPDIPPVKDMISGVAVPERTAKTVPPSAVLEPGTSSRSGTSACCCALLVPSAAASAAEDLPGSLTGSPTTASGRSLKEADMSRWAPQPRARHDSTQQPCSCSSSISYSSAARTSPGRLAIFVPRDEDDTITKLPSSPCSSSSGLSFSAADFLVVPLSRTKSRFRFSRIFMADLAVLDRQPSTSNVLERGGPASSSSS